MKILFVSLGCDKNLVDTEMMMGELLQKGYEFTDDEAEAEIARLLEENARLKAKEASDLKK